MKNKFIFACLVLFLIVFFIEITSFAVSQQELENKKKQIKSEISNKEDEIEDVKSKLSESVQEVQNLVDQISKYEDFIDGLNNKISDAENNISKKEQEITYTQNKIDEKKRLLEKRLVAIYESGNTSYLDFFLASANLTDFISKYYLISEIVEYDKELIEEICEEKTKLEISKEELENSKLELESNRFELSEMMSALNTTKKEKETKMAKLSSKEKELTEELEELKQKENQVSGQIQKLKEEYDKKLSTQKQGSSNNSSSSNSGSVVSSYGFCYPVSNTRTLGTLYGKTGKYWSLGYHTGIDFEVSSGTEVYSIGNGTVVDVGYSSAYGNYVEVYHGNNIYSFYAHNTKVIVSIGQDVVKGEQISSSGDTGNVTGPHLHFEIRTPGSKFANCVNPLNYLP